MIVSATQEPAGALIGDNCLQFTDNSVTETTLYVLVVTQSSNHALNSHKPFLYTTSIIQPLSPSVPVAPGGVNSH